jgi:2'-5' RNA ligase
MSAPTDPPAPSPLRLFAAVDLSPEVLERVSLEQARLKPRAPGAKWVSPESMHLTLFFFGWVAPDRVAGLEAVLARAVEGHPPMTLVIRTAGTFGSRGRPRVLWLGLEGDTAALDGLQAAVTEQVVPLGFEAEARDFTPHLTLARSRDPHGDRALAECREALAPFEAGEARIDALVLYRSELSPKGARYTALQRHPLCTLPRHR